MLQLNVATLSKVVPDDVSTCPLVGADRRPQLTVNIQDHVCYDDRVCVVASQQLKQLSYAKNCKLMHNIEHEFKNIISIPASVFVYVPSQTGIYNVHTPSAPQVRVCEPDSV